MSTRTAKWLAIALWLFLLSAEAGWCWHKYTHRPCADVRGIPAVLNGEKGCLEEPK